MSLSRLQSGGCDGTRMGSAGSHRCQAKVYEALLVDNYTDARTGFETTANVALNELVMSLPRQLDPPPLVNRHLAPNG